MVGYTLFGILLGLVVAIHVVGAVVHRIMGRRRFAENRADEIWRSVTGEKR